ncbi:hypothetical protein Hanom_Chr10g00917361 [Helianthus anomalus]
MITGEDERRRSSVIISGSGRRWLVTSEGEGNSHMVCVSCECWFDQMKVTIIIYNENLV